MIVKVANPNDPRIAAYGHVADARWLKTAGLFVAEGRLVVERLIACQRFRLHSILVTPAAFEALDKGAGIEAPIFIAERDVISRIAGFDFHRGCLALAARPGETPSPNWTQGPGFSPSRVSPIRQTSAACSG